MRPPLLAPPHSPRNQNAECGQASCSRTSSASRPPISRKISVENKNCTPIILWSVEKMYLPMKPGCTWACACASLMESPPLSAHGGPAHRGGFLALPGGPQPPVEVLLRFVDVHPADHVVMAP